MEENEEQILQIDEEYFKSAEYLNRIQDVAENQEELPDLKIEEGRIFKRSFDKNQPELGEFICEKGLRYRRGTLMGYFVSWRYWKNFAYVEADVLLASDGLLSTQIYKEL